MLAFMTCSLFLPVKHQLLVVTVDITIYCERFQVFRAVTMKNTVFWDIRTQFVPHRKHYVSATEPNRLILCKI
jgi:hypothetical protein